MQLAKAIMNPEVFSLDLASSALDAAKVMRDQDIGFVCLTKAGTELAGCVTDRDLVLGTLASGKSGQARLSEFCTKKDIATVKVDSAIEDAIATMKKHKTQRVVVVDEKSNPVGVISLADLVDKCEDKEIVMELLTNIKEPH